MTTEASATPAPTASDVKDPVAAPAAPAAAPAPAAPDAAEPPKSTLSGGDAPAGDAPTPQTWPDDWRERWAGKDDKMLGRLKRFASPDNVFKSFVEADAKIRSGQFKRTLADDATEEEVAAYRKENAVPDAPDGYGLSLPEGVEGTDADKAILGHFADVFHKMHLPASTAKGIVQAFHEHAGEVTGALRAAAREATINNRATLRSEYGKEYDRNVNLATNYLDNIVGEDSRVALVEMKLADGTMLGDNPAFVKLAVQAALAGGDDAAIAVAELGSTATGSLDEQFKAAVDLRFTDTRKYASPEHQKKLFALAAAKAKRAEKAA